MKKSDKLQRSLRDLRISVTDRCNFRCTYCMPKEVFGTDYTFLDRTEILSFEEIVRLARLFVDLGVQKIRLTGGEPLVRRNIERLIESLSSIPGIDLALTTNGSFPLRKIKLLKEAGLQRMTVSLDALEEEVFRKMNDADFPVQRVLDWVAASADAGMSPVKINMVVKRGLNEESVLPMAAYFKGSGHIVRFIEFMDVGSTNGWRMDDVVPAAEIIRTIDGRFPLEPVENNYSGEVARRYRYKDGTGEIGVIASVTHAFCGDCTRARLSTEGMLYTCLFASTGFDLRALLRGGKSDEDIRTALGARWALRDDRYSELRSTNTEGLPKVEMSYIGG